MGSFFSKKLLVTVVFMQLMLLVPTAKADLPMPNPWDVQAWLITVSGIAGRELPSQTRARLALQSLGLSPQGRAMINAAADAIGYHRATLGAGGAAAARATCMTASGAGTALRGSIRFGLTGVAVVGGVVVIGMAGDVVLQEMNIASNTQAYKLYRLAYHRNACTKRFMPNGVPAADADVAAVNVKIEACAAAAVDRDVASFQADTRAANSYMCNVYRFYGF